MPDCTNPEIGDMLHAYELNVLTEDETARFEAHLLMCDSCYEELANFEREAALITSDEDVKRVMIEISGGHSPRRSRARELLRQLWPEGPIWLKPALLYLILLIMALPFYRGLRTPGEEEVSPLQTVSLLGSRSPTPNAFQTGQGAYGLLEFLIRNVGPGKSCRLLLTSEEGRVIYRNDEFTQFDEYGTAGTGRLLLPISRMSPGNYRLEIRVASTPPDEEGQVYEFQIEE